MQRKLVAMYSTPLRFVYLSGYLDMYQAYDVQAANQSKHLTSDQIQHVYGRW